MAILCVYMCAHVGVLIVLDKAISVQAANRNVYRTLGQIMGNVRLIELNQLLNIIIIIGPVL